MLQQKKEKKILKGEQKQVRIERHKLTEETQELKVFFKKKKTNNYKKTRNNQKTITQV